VLAALERTIRHNPESYRQSSVLAQPRRANHLHTSIIARIQKPASKVERGLFRKVMWRQLDAGLL
ncbi:hypothetical protein ACQR1W_35420, partial [Bradyrhizobium sp. HKCCYLS1011]|uniref:hypothetical protein n=1 Tax=Bradyrhizobium sp. HKCCYLS1011 TaxID=3420733 RepID=UPI003EBEC996